MSGSKSEGTLPTGKADDGDSSPRGRGQGEKAHPEAKDSLLETKLSQSAGSIETVPKVVTAMRLHWKMTGA